MQTENVQKSNSENKMRRFPFQLSPQAANQCARRFVFRKKARWRALSVIIFCVNWHFYKLVSYSDENSRQNVLFAKLDE